jgi:hypothetical protein
MDSKEAVQAALQQIEEDEAAFGTDFVDWFKALVGLGEVHNASIRMRVND